MKFKKNDMVLYLPCSDPRTSTGYVIMYVMGYDEKKAEIQMLRPWDMR